MSAKHYEKPPEDVIDQYVEMDGVWHLKDGVDFTPQDSVVVDVGAGEFSCEPGEWVKIDQCGIGDVNSDERGSGARFNSGKPPMNYIPLRQQIIVWRGYERFTQHHRRVMDELAKFEHGEVPMWNVISLLTLDDLSVSTYVWEYGAEKYAAFNWAKGMKWSIPLACISRHMQAILRGEELDEESGHPHWGHVVCNLLMLEHYGKFYREGDDRPPKEVF